jgi:hypothetical protein
MTTYKQLQERINMAKAKMGDVIKDFQDSDAPQFKGKSDEKRREMAIAAKMSNEEVEELDEISKELGQKYMNKAAKSMSDSSYGSKTYNKRNKGISTALEKIRPGTRNPSKFSTMEPVKKPVKVAATEEVEQTEEGYHVMRNGQSISYHQDKESADKRASASNMRGGSNATVVKDERGVKEELKGDQHKIDANKNGKVDGHDFKLLRGKKK